MLNLKWTKTSRKYCDKSEVGDAPRPDPIPSYRSFWSICPDRVSLKTKNRKCLKLFASNSECAKTCSDHGLNQDYFQSRNSFIKALPKKKPLLRRGRVWGYISNQVYSRALFEVWTRTTFRVRQTASGQKQKRDISLFHGHVLICL